MTHFECQMALNEKLDEYAKSKKIKIAYPNVNFKPDVARPWFKLFYLPTTSTDIGFGKNNERIKGIMQVDIFIPRGRGTWDGYKYAEELQNVFGINTAIHTENGVVRITEFNLDSFQEDDWFRIMVEIHYTSFN